MYQGDYTTVFYSAGEYLYQLTVADRIEEFLHVHIYSEHITVGDVFATYGFG